MLSICDAQKLVEAQYGSVLGVQYAQLRWGANLGWLNTNNNSDRVYLDNYVFFGSICIDSIDDTPTQILIYNRPDDVDAISDAWFYPRTVIASSNITQMPEITNLMGQAFIRQSGGAQIYFKGYLFKIS